MSRILKAYLHDELAGVFEQDNGGDVNFIYEDSYLSDPNATPLSLSMPLSNKIYFDHKGSRRNIPTSFLGGLLIESNSFRKSLERKYHVDSSDDFGLLELLGKDCAGAIVLLPESEDYKPTGSLNEISDEKISELLREQIDLDIPPQVVDDNAKWSLAGAQSKIALRREGDRWFIPTEHEPTSHIIKPGIKELKYEALNEHLMVSLARELGISAEDSEYVAFGEMNAIVAKRYDRYYDGKILKRRHQEDFCQALGKSFAYKYETTNGGVTLGQCIRIIKDHCSEDDLYQFVNYQVFNYLIGGTDAHAKNFSLLLEGDKVKLAPLYDVASAFPHFDDKKYRYSKQLAFNIGGNREMFKLTKRNLERLATENGLSYDLIIENTKTLLSSVSPQLNKILGENDTVEGTSFLRDGLLKYVERSVNSLQTELK